MAVHRLIAACDHDRGPQRERQLQLQHRDIEGQRGDGHEHVIGGKARLAAMLVRKLTTARCGTTTPLGLPVEPEV